MPENRVELEAGPSPERSRYRVLLEITDQIARAPSLPDAFREFALPVLDLTAGELLNLSLHDPSRDCMLNRYWKRNRESGEFAAAPVEEAASGWAWKHQETMAIRDIEREQRFPGCVPVLLNHGVRSLTVLPMSTPSRHFGALGLGKRVPEVLGGEDVEFLSRVALLGAFALEKERAFHAFEEQQSLPLEQALSARAIQIRNIAFFAADELRDMRDPLAKAMHALGIQSVCSVPLIAGNRVWGALNTSSMIANAFSPTGVEYLQQVANQIAAALQNAHAYCEIAELKDRLVQEKRYLEYEIRSAHQSDDIVGASAALKRVLDHAAIVADTDSTVLLTGETGTGKERIARLIHGMSRRKDRSFIKLNCAAIPTGLLESELFGHEKGAFTGAVSQKAGRLELADQGTLFLDEVGEIPLELQPKLLRVLQDQEFERLGGMRTIRVDVRLIAATNRDLLNAVEAKQFRSDLYYRLHVFPLHLPALRERREDIPRLVRHFVEKSAARLNKRIEFIPDEAIDAMLKWKWPGNIRELENFIERSIILSEGNTLRPPLSELRLEIPGEQAGDDGTLRQKERAHIVEVLRQTRGVLSGPAGAAARLGLKRTTLQSKLQKLGISRMDYLN